jgi:hypothetical protein
MMTAIRTPWRRASRIEDAFVHAAPQGVQAEELALLDQEVRRNPQVDAPGLSGCGAGQAVHGRQHGRSHGLGAAQEAAAEEEGLDEPFERYRLMAPERLQGRGGRPALLQRALAHPGGVEAAFEMGVAVDPDAGMHHSS